MGVRHPKLVRAVAVHSGIACGAARSAFTAIGVMQRGPETDVEAIAGDARRRGGRPVPLLAVHGEADGVVAAANATALVRQYLRFAGHPSLPAPMLAATALPGAEAERRDRIDGRVVTTREWRVGGRPLVRYVSVAGLGHAWSGGDDVHPNNDPLGPDATALIADFLRDAVA
jgi:poly(3-hydroxybutyrate) depolymerase